MWKAFCAHRSCSPHDTFPYCWYMLSWWCQSKCAVHTMPTFSSPIDYKSRFYLFWASSRFLSQLSSAWGYDLNSFTISIYFFVIARASQGRPALWIMAPSFPTGFQWEVSVSTWDSFPSTQCPAMLQPYACHLAAIAMKPFWKDN